MIFEHFKYDTFYDLSIINASNNLEPQASMNIDAGTSIQSRKSIGSIRTTILDRLSNIANLHNH